MLGNTYSDQQCSVARALEVVGERWTLLILRNVFIGLRRFDQIQKDLGVARNVLQSRLERLVEQGIVEKHLYQERPPRHEYRLTAKGVDLWFVVVSLQLWGDEHHPAPGGPPTVIRHRDCGGSLTRQLTCDHCGQPMGPRDSVPEPGPGAPADHPLVKAARA